VHNDFGKKYSWISMIKKVSKICKKDRAQRAVFVDPQTLLAGFLRHFYMEKKHWAGVSFIIVGVIIRLS
jgi:hypothetical protein